ncbi:MAG: DinB family protein [Chloroflexi bacterium]|nr:DinB family protein [Chloroflexota bacterium]
MISPQTMIDSFDRNVQIIKRQTDGLTHADSLIQLPFRANCMNWLIGHILTNRNNIMKLLNTDPTFTLERAARYARESEPITTDEAGVLPLEELIAELDRAQACLANVLAAITPEELERQVAFFGGRSMSVAEWLLFFYFHDSYHVGQTEIMRQATGKDDKVI